MPAFTKAGAALFLSQSAGQALEAQLGTPLFRRSTWRLQLTAAGEIFYRAVLDAFTGLDEAARRGSFLAAVAAKLRLSVTGLPAPSTAQGGASARTSA